MISEEDNQIRFVCLSDLHLGDEDSILNSKKNEDGLDASDVMKNLAKCLESLLAVKTLEKDRVPRTTLILNGDIMELALGKFELSAMMFERFMALVMKNRKELFDNEIIFIPGNHDHHIWETARETQYENYILRKNLKVLPAPWHRTSMIFNRYPIYSTFLMSLLKRHTVMHDKLFSPKLKIQISYPNLAIPSEDQKSCVIIHHGQFTERPYYLISDLNTTLTGGEFPEDIDKLEEENFAWIDFFWSTLGRSGQAGSMVRSIYENMKNPTLIGRFFDKISVNLAKKFDVSWLPGTWVEEKALKEATHIGLPLITSLLGERNRRDTSADGDDLMNQEIKSGLNQVLRLSWPLMKDGLPKSISDMTLVYGHTHKPLERVVDLDEIEKGINESIALYNTGGWIVDQTEANADFGASIVLMDRNLNVVSLQVYREGGLKEVLIRSTKMDSKFYEYVKGKIEESPNCWNDLLASANAEYQTKVNSLKKRLE
jgi:hypothetical protein